MLVDQWRLLGSALLLERSGVIQGLYICMHSVGASSPFRMSDPPLASTVREAFLKTFADLSYASLDLVAMQTPCFSSTQSCYFVRCTGI